jgi:hypothetical protein
MQAKETLLKPGGARRPCQERKYGPLDGAVAMAADDEQVRVVLLGRVAEHVPGLPLDHLDQSVHLHCMQLNLGKKLNYPIKIPTFYTLFPSHQF